MTYHQYFYVNVCNIDDEKLTTIWLTACAKMVASYHSPLISSNKVCPYNGNVSLKNLQLQLSLNTYYWTHNDREKYFNKNDDAWFLKKNVNPELYGIL